MIKNNFSGFSPFFILLISKIKFSYNFFSLIISNLFFSRIKSLSSSIFENIFFILKINDDARREFPSPSDEE